MEIVNQNEATTLLKFHIYTSYNVRLVTHSHISYKVTDSLVS